MSEDSKPLPIRILDNLKSRIARKRLYPLWVRYSLYFSHLESIDGTLPTAQEEIDEGSREAEAFLMYPFV